MMETFQKSVLAVLSLVILMAIDSRLLRDRQYTSFIFLPDIEEINVIECTVLVCQLRSDT